MITKTGKALVASLEDERLSHVNNVLLASGAGGLSGAALFANSLKSGDLTGRQRLYFAADAQGAKRIPQNGIFSGRGNVVHLSRDADAAKQVTLLRNAAKNSKTPPHPVEVNLPTWKYTSSPLIPKGKAFKDAIKSYKNRGLTHEQAVELWHSSRKTRAFYGNVGSEYVVGGPKYQRNSLREVLQYAKSHPEAFARGMGKAVGGAGLLGLAALGVRKALQESDLGVDA